MWHATSYFFGTLRIQAKTKQVYTHLQCFSFISAHPVHPGSYFKKRGGLQKWVYKEGGGILLTPPASRKNSIFRRAREGLLTSKSHLIISCAILWLLSTQIHRVSIKQWGTGAGQVCQGRCGCRERQESRRRWPRKPWGSGALYRESGERCQIIVITITNNNFRLRYVSSKLDQVLLLLLLTNKLWLLK
jgi:hypothetical protein